MATVTLVPSSYTGLSNISNNSSYPLTNGYTDTNSSTYARLQTSTSGQYTGVIYYCFDTSSIPSGATINSVTVKAKWSVSSTSNISAVSVQPSSGTTLKGSANTTRSTTATVYTLSAGTWTREELDNARLYVTFTRTSGGGSRYMYFYGAELIVDYTEGEPRTVTSTLTGDGTISPSGAQTYYDGNEYELHITPTNASAAITVTNNGTDVTSQLVAPGSASDTLESVLGAYELTSGSFNGSGASYFSGIVGNGHDATQTTSNYYSGGSGTIAEFTYDMGIDIPSDATVTGCYVMVNGHAESTSNSNEYMCAQLYAGSTALTDELNFKDVGTSNSTQTLQCNTLPTAAQCADLKLHCRLGYYGGAINGATVFVTYTHTTDYYTYAYTVDGDATIAVTIGSGGSQTLYYKVNDTWVEASAIYKKVNEIWVQQSDLLNVFDSEINYKFEF